MAAGTGARENNPCPSIIMEMRPCIYMLVSIELGDWSTLNPTKALLRPLRARRCSKIATAWKIALIEVVNSNWDDLAKKPVGSIDI